MQVISSFKHRLLTLACVAALGTSALLVATPASAEDAPAATAPKDTARAEVGTPLQAAQKLIAEKKFKDAMAKVKEAEAVANRTSYENYLLESMRAAAAAGAGDDDTAVAAYEQLLASGRLPAASQQRIEQAVAGVYFKQKKYDKAISTANRYFKDGGTDGAVKDLIFMALYNSNDFKTASSEIHAQLDADDKAERTPKELHLQLALNSDQKISNSAGASEDLEKLLAHYPKKDYWALAINHVQHKTPDRLVLDLLRLELAMGTLHRDSDFMEMAQLAIEAGFPTEARKVLDQGFSSGVLGKGPEADRQKRLKDKATKDAAEDQKDLGGDPDAEKAKPGDAMLKIGMNYVLNGKSERGLSLMEGAIAKGGLRSAEEAKLHLGIALYWAGDHAKAAQVLRGLSGKGPVADLGHLWGLYAGSKH